MNACLTWAFLGLLPYHTVRGGGGEWATGFDPIYICVCVQIAQEHHRSHFRSISCHSNMFDLATRVASTPGLDDDITDILSMRLQHAPIADVELAVEPVVEQAIVPAVPHVEPWERIWRLLR